MKKRISSFLYAVLAFVLLVSLVCLSVVYMMRFRSGDEARFDADDMMALEHAFAAAGYIDSVGAENVRPVFVGVSAPGAQDRTGAFTGAAFDSLYEDCFSVVKKYISKSPERELSENEAEAYRNSAYDSSFIYIRYPVSYPKSIIVSFSDKASFADDIGGEYIREIFVFYSSKEAEVVALTISEESCYIYKISNGYGENFNKNIINEYNNAVGTFDFAFATDFAESSFVSEERFNASVCEETVVSFGEQTLPKLHFSNVHEALKGAETASSVLSIFTLNPEKVTVFTESDGTVSYFEERQNLYIRPDGTVEYTGIGTGGIDIGSVIGYNFDSDSCSLRDKIGATLLISAQTLRAAGINPEIELRLSNIYHDENKNFVITYSYVYAGISIVAGEPALSFTVSGNTIKKASLRLVGITEVGNAPLPFEPWFLTAYAAADGRKADFLPAYELALDKSVLAGYISFFKEGEK